MKINNFLVYSALLGALISTSCSGDDDSTSGTTEENEDVTVEAVAENYANIVRANYADALSDAQALEAAINNFTSDPTVDTFDAAKEAWVTARESYGTTEAFRLSDGPIDRVDETTGEEGPEGLLNSWPMDEAVVDYVLDETTGENIESGVINDTSITIDIETLAEQNGGGDDETEVFVGFHAIEFLLWGQDNTDPSEELAGLRGYTDYTTADNADRRAEYLNEIAAYVVENLEYLVDQWAEGTNYDVTFSELSDDEILFNLFSGLGKFSKGELAGERMVPGWEFGSQEDEHSCFSDNTHRDISLNYDGVKNVYYGTYGTISGASLSDLVTQTNAETAALIDEAFEATDTAVETATTGDAVPFDNAILSVANGGDETLRGYIRDAIDELFIVGDLMVTAAGDLGVTVTAELDE